jgi:hypothetical protein
MSDTNFAIAEAVRDTEAEIFNDAAGVETDDASNDPSDRDLEMPEGFDGTPLSEADLIATTSRGHDLPGFDRPATYAAETEEFQKNRERAERAERDNAALIQHYDPQLRERAEQRREFAKSQLIDEAVTNPDRLLDNMAAMNNHRQALDSQRVEGSLAAAHKAYGKDFETAYSQLVNQPQGDPLVRAVVQRIWNAPDPGHMLMRLAYGNELGSGQEAERSSYSASGNPPPFMPQGQRSAPGDRSAEEMSGWGTPGQVGSEKDIFDFAARE